MSGPASEIEAPHSRPATLMLGLARRVGRARAVVTLDAATTAAAYVLCSWIINAVADSTFVYMEQQLALLIPLSIMADLLFGVYNRSCRFFSLVDIPTLCKFVIFSAVSFCLVVIFFSNRTQNSI